MFGASGMSQEMPLEWMYRMVPLTQSLAAPPEIHPSYDRQRVLSAASIIDRNDNVLWTDDNATL